MEEHEERGRPFPDGGPRPRPFLIGGHKCDGRVGKTAGGGENGTEIPSFRRAAPGRRVPHDCGHERGPAIGQPVLVRAGDGQVLGHARPLPAARPRSPFVRRPIPKPGTDARPLLPDPVDARVRHERLVPRLGNAPVAGIRENRYRARIVRLFVVPVGRVRRPAQRARYGAAAGVHVRLPGPAVRPGQGRAAPVGQRVRLQGRRGPGRRGRAAVVHATGPRSRRSGCVVQRRVRPDAQQPVRRARPVRAHKRRGEQRV